MAPPTTLNTLKWQPPLAHTGAWPIPDIRTNRASGATGALRAPFVLSRGVCPRAGRPRAMAPPTTLNTLKWQPPLAHTGAWPSPDMAPAF